MTRAADVRALEGVTAGSRRLERHGQRLLAALGDPDVDVRADDPEAVVGVVAAQADFERRARLDANLRRREAETLRDDLDPFGLAAAARGADPEDGRAERQDEQHT